MPVSLCRIVISGTLCLEKWNGGSFVRSLRSIVLSD